MKNVLEWLENTAIMLPDKIAFADEQAEITFATLLENAKKVGTALANKTNSCAPVAFYMRKSVYAVCGIFGTVYAGGCYSFVDLRQPKMRAEKILDILAPTVLLTDAENYEDAVTFFGTRAGLEIIKIEELLLCKIDQKKLDKLRRESLDIDPLYVNFTSGSTGNPKGVAVSHRSVIDFIEQFTKIFQITDNDVIGNQAPLDFDVSVKDIYSGILTGATVEMIPRNYFSAPMQLMDFLAERKVTTLIWAVSAMCFVSTMNGLEYRTPASLKKILFSGETMPVKHLNIWKKYLPDAMYVNVYGPTEITCNCTYHILDRDYELNEMIPIGKAFPNEKVFLLDESDHVITKENELGEICVGGTCLALGYYKDEEKTKQVFVQNPANHTYYERIYRTGDLGKYNENGDLIYATRKDFQIKYLGHRIELGEIENVAQSLDGITRACCLFDDRKKKLLMFYSGDREKSEVLSELKNLLPPFMIPGKIYRIDEMPMTKNGKIDRSCLKKQGGIL